MASLASYFRAPLAVCLAAGGFPHLVQAETCSILQGNAIQGGVLWGQVTVDAAVTFAGHSVPLLADGYFLIGLGRDMPASNLLEVNADAVCSQEVGVSRREYRTQSVTGVPQQTVTPSEAHLERIRRERALVRAAKNRRIEAKDGLVAVQQGFSWPVTGRISGVYGSQRIYNGTPGTPHYGVDVARPTGTPVTAPAPGEVTLAEPDLFYSGGTVILDHGYGFSSSFLHLSEVSVEVGDRLQTGDVLGAIGATGRATGPHLDWRMSWLNQRIDPQLLVPAMPD
ncbi:MAG: M23 family metallopeptidase [Luminiphilus sp.]|nr:M23 family metallopeptidase [Luminiphilus sp.]